MNLSCPVPLTPLRPPVLASANLNRPRVSSSVKSKTHEFGLPTGDYNGPCIQPYQSTSLLPARESSMTRFTSPGIKRSQSSLGLLPLSERIETAAPRQKALMTAATIIAIVFGGGVQQAIHTIRFLASGLGARVPRHDHLSPTLLPECANGDITSDSWALSSSPLTPLSTNLHCQRRPGLGLFDDAL